MALLETTKEKLVKMLKPLGYINSDNEVEGILSVHSVSEYLNTTKTTQPFIVLYSENKGGPVVGINNSNRNLFESNRNLFESYFFSLYGFQVEYKMENFSRVNDTWAINILNINKIIKYYDTKVELSVLNGTEILKKILNIGLTVDSHRIMFLNIKSTQEYIIVYSNSEKNPVIAFNLQYSHVNKSNIQMFEESFFEKHRFKPIYKIQGIKINNLWNIFILDGTEILKKILKLRTVDSASIFLTRENLRNLPYDMVYSNNKENPVVGFSVYNFTENNNDDPVENLKTNREKFLNDSKWFLSNSR